MDSSDKTARAAGLIYLANILAGIFSLLYVPSHINVHGDTAATIANIVASEALFRYGIAIGAIAYVMFLLLPIVLYRLLSQVNRSIAIVMVALALACIPIDFAALANQLDVLSLLNGDKYQEAFTPEQLNARAMSLLNAYRNKILVSEIFWGLWLFPFGYLVFKSRFLPRLLGIALMLGCFSYLVIFFGEILFPHYDVPGFVMVPATIGEMGICLWLLIFGVKRHASMEKLPNRQP